MARPLAAIVVASIAAVVVLAGPAAAADALQLEIVGVEFTPFSFNYAAPYRGARPSPFQPGLGVAVRAVRLRWTRVYWTLVQAGFFTTGAATLK